MMNTKRSRRSWMVSAVILTAAGLASPAAAQAQRGALSDSLVPHNEQGTVVPPATLQAPPADALAKPSYFLGAGQLPGAPFAFLFQGTPWSGKNFLIMWMADASACTESRRGGTRVVVLPCGW